MVPESAWSHAGLVSPHRAVHSVVLDGFAANELAVRITDWQPQSHHPRVLRVGTVRRVVGLQSPLLAGHRTGDHKPIFC